MEKGQPVIILVLVTIFVSLAAAAVAASEFLALDIAHGAIWALLSVLTAIFAATIAVLAAVGKDE